MQANLFRDQMRQYTCFIGFSELTECCDVAIH